MDRCFRDEEEDSLVGLVLLLLRLLDRLVGDCGVTFSCIDPSKHPSKECLEGLAVDDVFE